MDFNDTPAEAEYRSQARAWLEANANEYREPPEAAWKLDEFIKHSKAWQARKFAAGYTGITWPKAFGCNQPFRHRKSPATCPGFFY